MAKYQGRVTRIARLACACCLSMSKDSAGSAGGVNLEESTDLQVCTV